MKEVKSEGLEFAQALNKWMEENNISEPQLVELTGIAQSSVNEYRRKGLKGTEIIRKTTIKNLEKLYQFTKLPIIATILHQSKKGRSKKSSPSMAKIPPKERIPQTNLDPLASIREINLGLKAIANLPENLAKLIAIIGELIQKNDSLSIAKNTDKIPDLPEKMPQEISVAERMRHFNQLLIILNQHLQWFRKSTLEDRQLFSQLVDGPALGYVSVLMQAMTNEDKLARLPSTHPWHDQLEKSE